MAASGSFERRTRAAACTPKSCIAHTFSFDESAPAADAARLSRSAPSDSPSSGSRAPSARHRKPCSSASSSSASAAPPPAPSASASPISPSSATFASSIALYSMFLIASCTPYPCSDCGAAPASAVTSGRYT